MQVAFDSVTRFEDPERLPLGTSINSVAYSADMLTQAAFEPQASPGSLSARPAAHPRGEQAHACSPCLSACGLRV